MNLSLDPDTGRGGRTDGLVGDRTRSYIPGQLLRTFPYPFLILANSAK